MVELKQQLDRFWDWAQLTPEEYCNNISPRNPAIYLAEWEDEYLEWRELEFAFQKILSLPNCLQNKECVGLILEAIAIDNEREKFADISSLLSPSMFEVLLEASLKSNFDKTQWQLLSRIPRTNISSKKKYLTQFVSAGATEYVKNRARLILKSLDEK